MGRPAGGRALKEHDQVVLTTDLPEDGLRAGDVGVIALQTVVLNPKLVLQDGHGFSQFSNPCTGP